MSADEWAEHYPNPMLGGEKTVSERTGPVETGNTTKRITCECEPCDNPAVWAWQPPGADEPVLLCDEDASGADLDHLRALDGLAEVPRG